MDNKIKFKEFELKNFVKIQNGFAFKSSEFKNKGIPIVRISNFNNSNLDLSNAIYYSNEFNNDKNKNYFLEKNDILIAMSGATVGKLGFVIKENLPCILNQRIGKFKILNKNLLNNFLKYFLKSDNIQNLIFKKSIGCAQPNLSSNDLLNLKIPIPINSDQTPNLAYQEKVVKELEKIETAIEKKKKAIELNKEYLESLFYEMFGSPIKNEKGWKIEKITSFCANEKNSIKAGPFGSSLKKIFYVKKGYKIYGQEQVIKNDFNYGNYYIDENKYKTLENYKIKENDILISLVGTFGKIVIVPKKFEKGIINPRLMKITLDLNKSNPIFFKNLIIFLEEQIKKYSHGGVMGVLNIGIIKKINFIIPPITLQNKFAKEVEKYEKIREKQEKTLEKSDDLFNSTMQKAFIGEL